MSIFSKAVLLIPLVIASNVLAFPGLENEYIPSALLEERGPCPGLNTLANHGFINRDGKNITGTDMSAAIEEVYALANANSDFVIEGFVDLGLAAGLTEDGDAIFNLFDLYPHNVGEHDASLVRHDEFFGEFAQFDEQLFEELAALSSDGVTITFRELAQHQANRIVDSRRRNPEVDLFSDDDDEPDDMPVPSSALEEIFDVDGRVGVLAAEALFCFLFGQDDDLQSASITDLFSFLGPNRIPEGWTTRHQRNQPIVGTLTLFQRLPDIEFIVSNIIESASMNLTPSVEEDADDVMDPESAAAEEPTAPPSVETTSMVTNSSEEDPSSASPSSRALPSIVAISMATLFFLGTAI